jgi:sec-independent protein translocase protein TatA
MQLGAPELLIILVIVIVLFGVGRIGRIGADLGTAVREFRKGLQPEDEKKPDDQSAPKS